MNILPDINIRNIERTCAAFYIYDFKDTAISIQFLLDNLSRNVACGRCKFEISF